MAIPFDMLMAQFGDVDALRSAQQGANPAFMEGIHAAKKGKTIQDNPYKDTAMFVVHDENSANLWDLGFLFQLEVMCAQ